MLPYSRLERISDVSACQIAMMTASLLFILASTATGLLFLFPDYIRAKLSLPPELSQFLLGWPVLARFGSAGGEHVHRQRCGGGHEGLPL